MKRTFAAFGWTLPFVALVGFAQAQELRIGLSSEPTSADPQFHALTPNNQLALHVFGALVNNDEAQRPVPGLARSWKTLDDKTWEFKLQPKATFSNGQKLTPRDVIYSFCRVPFVEGSPGNFSYAIKNVVAVEAPDAETLVIKTSAPDPLLPNNLTAVQILNADVFGGGKNIKFKPGGCEDFGANPKPVEFNDPSKAIGAGAYKFVEFTRGSQIVLERNDTYWGEKPYWKKVIMKPLSNAGARVAGLLAGDVDVIEAPPMQDIDRIKSAGFTLAQALTSRVIYIQIDQFKDPAWKSPGIKGTDKNPMLDKRVRQAMSMAINRQAIVERIMGGMAVAAGELLPYPMFGATKDFPVTKYDPDGAKKLLAEAGYPNGFEITLATPNDRYINDEKVAQAVAQMWTRIGIKTNVDAMTAGTFFTRRTKFEFSAFLAGWGSSTGEISNSLLSLSVTLDPPKGYGTVNRSRYSNPAMDAVVIKATETIDDKEREKLLKQASKMVADDVGILPLHFEVRPWALKKGLTYQARSDENTLAMGVKPGPSN